MKHRRLLAFLFAATAFSAVGFRAWHEHSAAVAYRELATIVSSVTNVTVYDCRTHGRWASSNDWASATATPFPVDVFSSAAGSAKYLSPLVTIYKGSRFAAIVSLRDGTERHAQLGLGGVFWFEGVRGYYTVSGRSQSQFAIVLSRIIEEQFMPKRKQPRQNG